MRRLHLHVAVRDLPTAIGFYSDLFAARPCCAGVTYANWRVDDPAVNFAVSIAPAQGGAMHFGIEVDTPQDLDRIDRTLRAASASAANMPWEVSVRRPVVRKESAS